MADTTSLAASAAATAKIRSLLASTRAPGGSSTRAPLGSGTTMAPMGIEDREEVWMPQKLKEKGGITEEQVKSALALFNSELTRRSRVAFGDVLTSHGMLTQAVLTRLRAEYYELPVYDRLSRETISSHTVKLISSGVSRRCRAIVVRREGEVATVAVADPNERVLREIASSLASAGVFGRKGAGLRGVHDFCVAPGPDVLSKLDECLASRAVSDISRFRERLYIDAMIREAVKEDASDIHFVPREKTVEIKYRIDGRLWTTALVPAERKDEVVANALQFGGLDLAKTKVPQDGSAVLEMGSRRLKLRFSALPTQYGQKVVVRILDQNATILPFADLGMSEKDAMLVRQAMDLPHGLIFSVGPTGSGKSTTLATLVSQLDGNMYNISTLEQPIEYHLSNASQCEVNREFMTFAQGVRALLRQDPDYILVGETRDLETAEIVIEAGLTGHTCFSTLHGNDAIGGIIRLLDLGVEAGPMLEACELFMAQRLVRRLCPKCRQKSHDSDEILERFKIPNERGEYLWEPVGCPDCRDGYKGRVGIYETRKMSDFREAVLGHGKACGPICKQIIAEKKMSTMQTDGFAKALQGMTTVDEVLTQVNSLT